MNSSISSFRRLSFAYAAAFVGVVSALVGASEWLVRSEVHPEDTLQKHITLFENTQSPYVAFGDSHVARGFDAQAPVVNLSYPSENVQKMAWKAARYLENAADVKTVLIQADPHLFSPYRMETGLQDYPHAFDRDARSIMLSLSIRYRPQLLAFWQAFARGGGRLTSQIETTPQGALLSPGNLASWRPSDIDKFTKQRLTMHVPDMQAASLRDVELYRAMVMRFVEAGADVCLVSFPTAPVYRDRFDALDNQQKRQWEKAMSVFTELAKHSRVRFVNDMARFDDPALFRDPDHLNKEGAIQYGPILQSACFNSIKQHDIIATTSSPAL